METDKVKHFEIFVNRKQIDVSQPEMTGRQILQAGSFDPAQYDLFLVKGQESKQIGLDDIVKIDNGLHFNAILKSVPYG